MAALKFIVGVDIGGSHITSGLVEVEKNELIKTSITRLNSNSNATAFEILETWKNCIKKCMESQGIERIEGIGFAMPGPFNYKEGVSLITGLGKFESLYGVNIKQYFSSCFDLPLSNIKFLNDAACFALGECFYGSAKGYEKGIFLTIGSGFGSTFLDHGTVVSEGDTVPDYGWLYHVPFEYGCADDYFCDRWILNRYKELTDVEFNGVKEIPDNNLLKDIFAELAANLATFIEPWILRFNAKCLVIGGSIVRYKHEFILPVIETNLRKMGVEIDVKPSELYEDAAILGAIAGLKYQENNNESTYESFRKTNQRLLPIFKDENKCSKYDMYPIFEIGDNFISVGYDSLVDMILNEKKVIIDGYVGIIFDYARIEIDKRLKQQNKKALWLDVSAAIKSENEISTMLEPFLGGNDPLFGKKCNLNLKEFYNEDLLRKLKYDQDFDLNIVIGIGASLCEWDAFVIYFDISKNEIQYRSRANSIRNLGRVQTLNPKEAYKRFYFVDWAVLNLYKNEIKDKISIYVDDQRYKNPLWIRNNHLNEALVKLSQSVIRVRPWFEAGAWGGTWLKNNIPHIEQDTVNYAWSFELIAPENGVILSSKNRMLEVPFDFFMFHSHESILGKTASEIFKFEFPIRFDFLDTFDGGNLSIQCHPGKEYMKENFGENLPQDETYYILDAKEDAKVYLGFQKDVTKDQFLFEVEQSYTNSTALQVDNFVKSHPSKKHDFFLIPHGTIHGSGKNNLVLEISSTPYIFTFKIYDWIRPDLDGKPRTLNIKRGFENLDFTRQGEIIEKEYICSEKLIDSGDDWKIYHLPTHPVHFYDVHRIEFETSITIETKNQFHLLMLVEGEKIYVETKNKYKQTFHYAETFLIPAAADAYEITNESKCQCKLVKAFLKPF